METDTRISAVTFFPTYHHPEKWSLVGFFSSCFGWHWDWVTRQPGLKAARYSRLCDALRETVCLRVWTNCACVTLDLDRASMTCELCKCVRLVAAMPFRDLYPFSTPSSVSQFTSAWEKKVNPVWTKSGLISRPPSDLRDNQLAMSSHRLSHVTQLNTRAFPWHHFFIINTAEHRTNKWAPPERGAAPPEH